MKLSPESTRTRPSDSIVAEGTSARELMSAPRLPRLRPVVVDVDVLDAVEVRRVPAEHRQPAVGQLHRHRAEQIPCAGSRLERLRRGIPDASRSLALRGRPTTSPLARWAGAVMCTATIGMARRRGPASDLVRWRRRGRRRARPNRRVHVGLDLGDSEGAVVDADVVEPALEPLSEAGVAADSAEASWWWRSSRWWSLYRRARRSRTAAASCRRRWLPCGTTRSRGGARSPGRAARLWW